MAEETELDTFRLGINYGGIVMQEYLNNLISDPKLKIVREILKTLSVHLITAMQDINKLSYKKLNLIHFDMVKAALRNHFKE